MLCDDKKLYDEKMYDDKRFHNDRDIQQLLVGPSCSRAAAKSDLAFSTASFTVFSSCSFSILGAI
jgi:hypothetical protein